MTRSRREADSADLPPPDMLAADAAVLENLRRLLPPEAFLRLPPADPVPQVEERLRRQGVQVITSVSGARLHQLTAPRRLTALWRRWPTPSP